MVYLPITSYCNALTLPETRGPNFLLPNHVVGSLCRFRDFEISSSGGADSNSGSEWTDWWLNEIKKNVSKSIGNDKKLLMPPPMIPKATKPSLGYNPKIMEALIEEIQLHPSTIDTLVIAGEGEPTLRLQELQELVGEFTKLNAGSSLKNIRLTTNGLVATDQQDTVLSTLQDVGVTDLSIAIMTSDSNQYNELMIPTEQAEAHTTVCNFIREAVNVGFHVETTAVDMPQVDKESTEQLSQRLKVTKPVRWRPYFG